MHMATGQASVALASLHPLRVFLVRAEEGENSYTRQLVHISAVLRDGAPSIRDVARGIATMRTMDAVHRVAGLQPR